MSPLIRILVVDDDFATLEFLRSILALAQEDFDVLGVPSAEEALLELRQAPFRLLISDVRLPGMSGLELVRSAWKVRPDLPVIMITAYTLSEVDQELNTLGISAFFRKPLDAEDFLEAVFAAVKDPEPVAQPVVDQPIRPRLTAPVAVTERLDSLRTDTGARQAVLATTSGEILYVSGSQPQIDLQQVVEAMKDSINSSFRLANELNQEQPLIIHFLSGGSCDVYFTNIDHDYFTAIFIDTQRHRGRIGTIWVFTQRAVRDIRRLLTELEATNPDRQYQDARNVASAQETRSGAARPKEPVEKKPPSEDRPAGGDQAPGILSDTGADELAVESPEKFSSPMPLADEQLESLLARLEGDEAPVHPHDELVDDFWEKALNTDSRQAAPGLSIDEAREQGLIGPNFDVDEE